MKQAAIFLLFAGLALPAGDPAGFQQWTSAQLKAFSKSLSPKMNAQKVATETWAGASNYSFMIAHREGPGEAELHETKADVVMVQSGEATLIIGGRVENGKTTAPDEIRGPSISGGVEKKLAPGDVVTIPAKMPHQIKPTGKEFTYFLVKVTQ
jgi:mannose-6-phosphate isomerase-like protein (cupin superfamily)